MKSTMILLVVVAMSALAVSASGETVTWTKGADGLYTDTTGWSTGALPATSDIALVADGSSTVTITDTGGATNLILKLQNGSNYLLTGSKVVQPDIQIGRYCTTKVVNTFTQQGGEIFAGYISIAYGSGRLGTYRIEGGKINQNVAGRFLNVGGGSGGGTGLFEVIGTGLVDTDPILISTYSFTEDERSTVHVELNSAGQVAVIQATNAVLDGYLTINDDAATGLVAGDTVTVLTASSGLDYADLTFSDPNWAMSVGGQSIVLTYVPEPATMILLGIGGLGVLLKRRRKSQA